MNRLPNRVTTLLACAAALPLLAAEKLSARIGLWETSTTTTMSGMTMPNMAIPPEALAAMPPAQRAQMEQMMKQMGAQGPQTRKSRSCVTEKDLSEGAFRQSEAQQDMQCKYTVVSSTAKRQETTFQCTTPAGAATGRMVMDVVDATHVRGSMQMKSPQMNFDAKIESQWLGASCAGADQK